MSDQENKKSISIEFTITREDDHHCATYHATARELAKIPYPIESPEWLDVATRKIKKFGHHEKLSVYERVKRWFNRTKEHPQLFDAAMETVEIKIRTHQDFSSRHYEEVM